MPKIGNTGRGNKIRTEIKKAGVDFKDASVRCEAKCSEIVGK